MDKEPRWKLRFENFEKAFKKLSDILLTENPGEIEQMALVQAFEFTFELGWKTMKDYLTENGFKVASPKETIRQAYYSGYIKNGDIWMESIIKRNESSHAYDELILETTSNFIETQFFKIAQEFYNDFKIKMNEQ